MIDGVYYTQNIKPKYTGIKTTLGAILLDEKQIPESFYIKEKDLPKWEFEKGAPYRAIAALEALATLVGVLAFAPRAPRQGDATATLQGKTDNRGNQYALTRLQTSKYPLCFMTVELSAQLESRSQGLLLRWAPREVNEEADRLSNGLCAGFDPAKRINVNVRAAPRLVLNDLSSAGTEFYRQVKDLKQPQLGGNTFKRRSRMQSPLVAC